jgi:hypothetical protein
MRRRARRPYDRKPWPGECEAEYASILALTTDIERHLLDVLRNGLAGGRNYLLLPELAPLVVQMARNIQAQCSAYDTKRRRGFPHWSGQAVDEVDVLAAAVVIALQGALEAYRQPRNPYLARHYLDEALGLVSQIRQEMQQGPGPAEDIHRQVNRVVNQLTGDNDDDTPTAQG